MRLFLTRSELIHQLGTPLSIPNVIGLTLAMGAAVALMMIGTSARRGTKKRSKRVCWSFDYAMKSP